MEIVHSTTRSTSHTLSTDHLQVLPSDMHDPKIQPLFSALSNSPHEFLQPPPSLHAAALELTKRYLDPLATSVSEVQSHRQRNARLKRKREESSWANNGQILKLKKLHLHDLDVEQVWGQVRLILEATMDELGRVNLPAESERSRNVKRQRQNKGQSRVSRSEVDSGDDSGQLVNSGDEDEEEDGLSIDINDGFENEGDDIDQISLKDKDAAFKDDDSAQSDTSVGEDKREASYPHKENPEDLQDIGSANGDDRDDEATSETVAEDPTGLNDGFFSLEEFNKQSQFLERQDLAGEGFNFGGTDDESIDWHADPMTLSEQSHGHSKKKGKPTHHDDDEEDGPTFGDMDLNAPEGESDEEEDGLLETDLNDKENTNDIRYEDFFAPPSRKVKVKRIRSEKSKRVDRQSNQKKGQDEHVREDDLQRTMEAVRRDLFEDELSPDEDSADNGELASDPKAQRSTHERRQAKLAEEIRQLELANVSKKEWTLSGEARAADRPINSLLEEDLEFERTGKPVPIITAELSESIEEMIKRRIIAQEFDELIRRRPDDLLNASEVRRGRFELDDNKAQQSLAELYEENYLRQVDPQSYRDKNRERLRKEHEEIENLWKDVCGKLDALSNWHYKPKPPKPSISIVAAVPTIAMEDARPSATMGGGQDSMLAPQEVYMPGKDSVGAGEVVLKSGVPVAKEEMSKEEKGRRRRRGKERLKKRLVGTDKEEERGIDDASRAEGRDAVMNTLKRGGVKVIGKKGEVRDVSGKKIKEPQRPSGVGSFKL